MDRFKHLTDEALRASEAQAKQYAHDAPRNSDVAGKLGVRWADLKDEMERRGLT